MADHTHSSTKRALSMASAGASVAGSYIGYLLQRAFLGKERGEARLRSTHVRAARRMRDEMQSLRGPAMKLGQTLSLQSGTLPDEFVSELATLQMEAPGMHPSLVRAQFKSSMGREPEEIFKKFSPEPFAAASLGQVHHATTREGEMVAVKIQYPGIRQAIENDFNLFRTVSKPAQASGHISKAAIDELEQQIVAETDYEREADNIEFFARKLAPLSFVKVPRVFRRYSSNRVLTMSLMTGEHLDSLLTHRTPRKLRDLLGTNLFELFYYQLLKVGALHVDPHWGNYLFTRDGSIALVDFGCVKYFQPETLNYLHRVFLYRGSCESADFRRILEESHRAAGQKLLPGARRALIRFSKTFYRQVYPPRPDEQREPFDFGAVEFLQEYLREAKNVFRTKGIMPDLIFLGRAEMGLYQTLHRLRARVPTSRIVKKYLRS